MRIAVVGAGPSGLVAAKYAIENGYVCDIFEQTGSLGGNWVYNENTNDVHVQSSVYKDLVTNIPKELMTYSDYHYPTTVKESYITHDQVLAYHHGYAEKFGLNKHIQYYTRVERITSIECDKWLLVVQNLETETETTGQYDCVFVCNGRFKDGFIPTIPGQSLFKGRQMHSHTFRVIDPYKEQSVLIVGGQHSGQDICGLICRIAKHVYVSSREVLQGVFPPNVSQKTEVTKFTEDGVVFGDGSVEHIDSVIYCTGYFYTCSFLTESCGVRVENNGVAPLYKQIVNIEHPTMFFIGLPYLGASNITFDLQVRFAMAAFQEKFKLPSKSEMLEEWDVFLQNKSKDNVPRKHTHRLGDGKSSTSYSEDLASTAKITRIPNVISKLYERVVLRNRARYYYRIIDDETFEEIIP
ncbi:flavin-containing monooxygenase FMO GS-OX4-like [Photinus pyralis]|nr:flavin-containing monooxygenase FMO GS-OX4-like [Photinus pyralis]